MPSLHLSVRVVEQSRAQQKCETYSQNLKNRRLQSRLGSRKQPATRPRTQVAGANSVRRGNTRGAAALLQWRQRARLQQRPPTRPLAATGKRHTDTVLVRWLAAPSRAGLHSTFHASRVESSPVRTHFDGFADSRAAPRAKGAQSRRERNAWERAGAPEHILL